jgi:hypothetical protein
VLKDGRDGPPTGDRGRDCTVSTIGASTSGRGTSRKVDREASGANQRAAAGGIVEERDDRLVPRHKARAVFERYNIVSSGDLRDAARRLDTYAASAAS